MAADHQETEAKFLVLRLDELPGRIEARGGRLLTARTHETNLRFDTPDGALLRARRLLRLRRDAAVHLTFKGPGEFMGGVRTRTELDMLVGDFEEARQFLQALGYATVFEYEKYRTTYALGEVQVMLDELPFGSFVEVEGKLEGLRPAAEQLGLDWNTAIADSYHALFERLQQVAHLPFRDLTFGNFGGRTERIIDLGVEPADRPASR